MIIHPANIITNERGKNEEQGLPKDHIKKWKKNKIFSSMLHDTS